MKKVLFLLITLCLFPVFVNAASGTVKVTGSSTGIVGNQLKVTVTISSNTPMGSWEADLNYNKSYLQLVSSTAPNNGTVMLGYTDSTNGTKSKSYTFTFKVLKSGSTNVSISSYDVYDNNRQSMTMTLSSLKLKLMTQAELEATYSKDNDLKELAVEGYELSPVFNKDTLEYTVTVPSDITKVNILAKQNDTKASLTGDGEKEVVEGTNTFEIVVTAENGSSKTYKINVDVEDINPINITIDNKSYTIVKRKSALEYPSIYEETTLNINGVEVPAFYSDITKFNLIGLKDKEGNIYYAIYNENTNKYTIYNESKSNTLNLYIVDFPEELKGYIKTTSTIDEVEVPVYKYKENSKFVIIYAMNIETGKYDYYSYDTENNTFQMWNQEEINELNDDLTTYLYVCIAFGTGLVFAFILIICLLSKGKKTKKIKNKIQNTNIKEEQKNLNKENEEIKKTQNDKVVEPEEVVNQESNKVEEAPLENKKDEKDLTTKLDKFDNFDFWADDKKKKRK